MKPGSIRALVVALTAIAIPITATAVYLFSRKKRNNVGKFYKVLNDNQSRVSLEVSAVRTTKSLFSLGLDQPLVIAMVGLPARGKSYIVKMIIRYLGWTGYESEVFNVGSYRRKIGHAGADASFFDTTNPDGQKIRENMAMAVQEDMYKWLHAGAQGQQKSRVAIFDATNTTKSRRLALANHARQNNVALLFVESICDDKAVLARNYELKLQNDDYKNVDPETARADFMSRVHAYEKVYETIEDDEDSNRVSYIKLINVGQKVITRNCTGYLASQVAFYLQNVHIERRRIFLTLLAENSSSEEARYNQVGGDKSPRRGASTKLLGKIWEDEDGGEEGSPDQKMSNAGVQYTIDLPKYLEYEQSVLMAQGEITGDGRDILCITGTSQGHSDTTERLRLAYPCYTTPLLDELRAGDFHGMPREEIQRQHPAEYEIREKNKLTYRYPGVGGESYIDVIERIRPIIIELERQRRSVVVVCHKAVLRCIFGYFMGTPTERVPYLPFDHHKIYALTPGPFGCSCREINVADEVNFIEGYRTIAE